MVSTDGIHEWNCGICRVPKLDYSQSLQPKFTGTWLAHVSIHQLHLACNSPFLGWCQTRKQQLPWRPVISEYTVCRADLMTPCSRGRLLASTAAPATAVAEVGRHAVVCCKVLFFWRYRRFWTSPSEISWSQLFNLLAQINRVSFQVVETLVCVKSRSVIVERSLLLPAPLAVNPHADVKLSGGYLQ